MLLRCLMIGFFVYSRFITNRISLKLLRKVTYSLSLPALDKLTGLTMRDRMTSGYKFSFVVDPLKRVPTVRRMKTLKARYKSNTVFYLLLCSLKCVKVRFATVFFCNWRQNFFGLFFQIDECYVEQLSNCELNFMLKRRFCNAPRGEISQRPVEDLRKLASDEARMNNLIIDEVSRLFCWRGI